MSTKIHTITAQNRLSVIPVTRLTWIQSLACKWLKISPLLLCHYDYNIVVSDGLGINPYDILLDRSTNITWRVLSSEYNRLRITTVSPHQFCFIGNEIIVFGRTYSER